MNEYESTASDIVSSWWNTQDQLIPTSRLQNPLIFAIRDAIENAVKEEKERAVKRVSDLYYSTRGELSMASIVGAIRKGEQS